MWLSTEMNWEANKLSEQTGHRIVRDARENPEKYFWMISQIELVSKSFIYNVCVNIARKLNANGQR